MAFISSPYGGRLCNAYSDWVQVNAYITETCVFQDPWMAASSVQAAAAMIRASQNIDALNWHGRKFFYDQLLEFPRWREDYDESDSYPARARETVPEGAFLSLIAADEYLRQQRINVQRAHAEQTLYLLSVGGRPPYRQEQFSGLVGASRSVRVGASYSFGSPDMVLCPEAFDYMRPYVGHIRLVRG